jgi:hypothetical protein
LNTAPTPNGELKDSLQKRVKAVTTPDGGVTKVIEAGGFLISQGLKKKDPFRSQGCDYGDPDCFIDPKQSCSEQGLCYRTVCNLCDSDVEVPRSSENEVTIPAPPPRTVLTPTRPRAEMVAGKRRVTMMTSAQRRRKKTTKCVSYCGVKNYVGQTGRTAHCRMSEHSAAIARKDIKNALAKHMMSDYPEAGRPSFMMKIISRHKSNLERNIYEALVIERQILGLSLNLRGEWGKDRGIVRLTASRI